MEKPPTQSDIQRENLDIHDMQSTNREKSTAELFAVRLMEDELRSYEKNWAFGGVLESAAKRNIDTMRSTLKEGDYTLALGQLLSEKGSLLKEKEDGTLDPKFDVDARIKDIDRIVTTLGGQEFPETKQVAADDAATYLDVRASKLAEFARLNKKTGGDMESFKQEMAESELYRQLANEINEAGAENREVSEEARQKIYEVLQKEAGFRARTAGRPYIAMANGEGNLNAYRNPSDETARLSVEELKRETAEALRVEAMGSLFKKTPKGGERSEADERKLQQLRSEIQATGKPVEHPQPEENRVEASKRRIENITIGGARRNPESKESPDKLKKISDVLRGYGEEAKSRRPEQVNSITVAIEGFKIAYPEESDCLMRINAVAEAYRRKLQEELKIYPENERGAYASNKTMEYILGSVLTRQERAAFERAAESEKRRVNANARSMRMQFSTPLESSLKDLFEAVA